jgi:transposase-like protein
VTAFPNSSHLNILISVSNSIPGAKQNPTCPACGCTRTVRKGKRRNRLQTLQVFQCAECLHRFTGEPGKNKTYPLKLILESVSTFNLGYSLTETQRLLRQRFHRDIPARTIKSWLTEYRPLTTTPACAVRVGNTLAPIPSHAPGIAPQLTVVRGMGELEICGAEFTFELRDSQSARSTCGAVRVVGDNRPDGQRP